MTTALTPARLDVSRLAEVDTDALVAELARALKLTVDHLVYLAALWAEIESRGRDLSHLRKGFGAWLPQIAAGSVLAETVVNFAGEPATLKRVAALPVHEQRDIADGKQPPPEPPRFRGPSGSHATLRRDPVLPGMPATPAPTPWAGEPTDDELDAACQPAKPVPPLQMLAAMIGNASPGDAAELVAECVAACGSAQLVAMRLIPLLERLARTPAKRPLAV